MILIKILGLAMVGHMAAEVFSQFDRLPSKPLKCNMCLTFWLSLIPFVIEYGWTGVGAAGCASLTSELIYKTLTRL